VYNLTAIRDRDEMIKLHFLDSLSILNYVNVKNLLDVGSGAGFPGVVLAIVKPEMKVTVMDSVNKKTTFMQHVKSELSLTNLNVVNGRVEEYQPTILFDAVTSRAFFKFKKYDLTYTTYIAKKWYVVGDEIKRCQRRIGSIRKESIHNGSA
jgi:16S rRNA (guanine527-N7)-methyltransferase